MINGNTPAEATTGASFNTESASYDTTAPSVVTSMEDVFLRALFALPSAQILTVIASLEAEDIYRPHHRIVFDALIRRARAQNNRGSGTQAVDPVVVQQDLMRDGSLDIVKSVLLNVVTGDPLPAAWVDDLAAGLRGNRLRRACLTVGEALIQAGRTGGHADLVRTLGYLPSLFILARRAGLDLRDVE